MSTKKNTVESANANDTIATQNQIDSDAILTDAIEQLELSGGATIDDAAYTLLCQNQSRLNARQSIMLSILSDVRKAGGVGKLREATATALDTLPCAGVKLAGVVWSYKQLESAGITPRMLREDMPQVERLLGQQLSRVAGSGTPTKRTAFRTTRHTAEKDHAISHRMAQLGPGMRAMETQTECLRAGLTYDFAAFADGAAGDE